MDANGLRTLKRLGVRYLSPVPTKAKPAPTGPSEAAPKKAATPERVPEPTGAAPGAGSLAELEQSIRECQACPLGKNRTHFVFGSGDPHAQVLFVGEAPGAEEDEQGLPFVGKAGQLLTKIIESTKTWKREQVYIANVLKCRPPANRTPLPEEVESCRGHLEAQIRILQPKLIMALGATAAQALLGTQEAVGRLRGRWHDYRGIPLRVTYHPAALLRNEGYKRDVWEDMKTLTAKFEEMKNQ